jgi:hypothetical protein
MLLHIISPDVLQKVAIVVEESAASSTIRVANHWPDKHQSQAVITLFQTVKTRATLETGCLHTVLLLEQGLWC